MQQAIIAPISKEIIKQELNQDRFIRTTRKGGNEIYFCLLTLKENVFFLAQRRICKSRHFR